MKTYLEEPEARYKILRQLASMRRAARKDGIDLNNRTIHESNIEGFRVGAFWMLVRLHISKRDNVEF
jgi:hypothetical protein